MEEGQGRLASVRNRACCAILPLAAIPILQTHLYMAEVKISGLVSGKTPRHLLQDLFFSETNRSIKKLNRKCFSLPVFVLFHHCDVLTGCFFCCFTFVLPMSLGVHLNTSHPFCSGSCLHHHPLKFSDSFWGVGVRSLPPVLSPEKESIGFCIYTRFMNKYEPETTKNTQFAIIHI